MAPASLIPDPSPSGRGGRGEDSRAPAPAAAGEDRALLRESSLSEGIIASLPGVFYVSDDQGAMVRWNDKLQEVTGYAPEEVARMQALDFFQRTDAVRVARAVQKVLSEGYADTEARLRTKAGKYILHYFTGTLVRTEGKTYVVGLGVDISERHRAVQALRESETRYRVVVEDMPAMVCRFLPDGTLTFVNEHYCRYFSKPREELEGQNFFRFFPEAERARAQQRYAGLTREHPAVTYEHQAVLPDGRVRWQRWTDRALFDNRGRPVEYQSLGEDITDRKLAEQALLEEKQRAEVTLHSIGDAVITTDAEGAVDYMNPIAERLTGWSLSEAGGRPLAQVFHGLDEETGEPLPDPVERCLHEGRTISFANHTLLASRGGAEYEIQYSAAPIREPSGHIFGVVLVFRDVTETRRLSRVMSYQATHDALTGLINRAEFERRLQRMLATSRADGSQHALCYLDLDQFKIINDTCGHVAGDGLMRQLSGALKEQVREQDTLARLGGDEFGVLVERCTAHEALRVAEALRGTVERFRFLWEERSFNIGVSIGLVPISEASGDTVSVLSAADAACYLAKEQGGNRIHVYQGDDADLARRHGEMQWAARLPQALEENRFELFAQPIMGIGSLDGEPTHYELLLRMRGEQGEIITPDIFLPPAERYGLSLKLDRWVVGAAFQWLTARPDRLDRLGLLSINLSGHSLGDQGFLPFVIEHLVSSGIPAAKICFEITETVAISNLSNATRLIKALKARGCRFALDDFGSGLSSFAYLKNLPVDFLKIDGSFVRDVASDPISFAFMKSINEIGHVMGKKTIAEFVDSQAILERLRLIGVDYVQGYLLGAPTPLRGVLAAPALPGD